MHYIRVNSNLKTCIVSYYHFSTGTKHTFGKHIKRNEQVGDLTPFQPKFFKKNLGRNMLRPWKLLFDAFFSYVQYELQEFCDKFMTKS